MKKITSIDLGRLSFSIEEEAYQKLKNYLESVKKRIGNGADKEEVMLDIEIGMAEKLKESLLSSKEVIEVKDIDNLISIMGKPEDFDSEDILNEENNENGKVVKKLYRNPDDMVLGGVCGGIGAYFSIDPVFVRMIFVILFFSGGIGLPIYAIFWIIIPMAETKEEKLLMKGSPFSIGAIEQSYKEKKEPRSEKGVRAFLDKVMRGSGNVFRRLLSLVWPIFKYCFAISLIVLSLVLLLGLIISIGIVLAYSNSDYYFADVAIKELLSAVPFIPMAILSILAIGIPCLLFIVLGLFLLTRRRFVNWLIIFISIAIWIIGSSILTVLVIRYSPDMVNAIIYAPSRQPVKENFRLNPVTSIEYSGHSMYVVLEEGDSPLMEVKSIMLPPESFSYEEDEGVLKLSLKEVEKERCIICSSGGVQVTISLPSIEKITMHDSSLKVRNSSIRELSINSSNSDISVVNRLDRIFLDSNNDRIEFGGGIGSIEGSIISSKVSCPSEAESVNLSLNDSIFNGFKGKVRESNFNLKNGSWVMASFNQLPSIESDKSSGLYYIYDSEEDIILSEGVSIRLEEVSSIEFNENRRDDKYFRFDGHYYIIREEGDDQFYRQYRQYISRYFQ